MLHQFQTVFPVGGDAQDAVIHQGLNAPGQGFQGFKQLVEQHRFKGVQFQLARFGGHGDAGVIADDVEGHLAHDLGNDRVDLAGHDGRAVLFGREIDLRKARPGTAGQEPQIIGHLGQRHSARFDDAGHMDEAVEILGAVDQVRGLEQGVFGHFPQLRHNAAQVVRRHVDGRADGRRAHIDHAQIRRCLMEPPGVPGDGAGIGVEGLAQTDGHGVL